jgi:hypothetical protein
VLKRPIENNSSPGQAVYEPFCGSGTTIIAAEITGRSCHAIELPPSTSMWRSSAGRLSPAKLPFWKATAAASWPLQTNGNRNVWRTEMGRRAHRPDPAQRRQVDAMAAYGIPELDISRVLGVDPKTLRKHYREEHDLGETNTNLTLSDRRWPNRDAQWT